MSMPGAVPKLDGIKSLASLEKRDGLIGVQLTKLGRHFLKKSEKRERIRERRRKRLEKTSQRSNHMSYGSHFHRLAKYGLPDMLVFTLLSYAVGLQKNFPKRLRRRFTAWCYAIWLLQGLN